MNTVTKAATRSLIALIPLGAALFLSAGDLAWTGAWCYFGMVIASSGLMLFGPFRLDPELIEERMKKPAPGAAKWDRILVAFVGVFTIAELLVPGFDHRWRWTTHDSPWKFWTGLIAVAAGSLGIIWAKRTNRFFSAVIRLQEDRGQYKLMRHPGYSFWILRTLGAPLLLGSHWAFTVAIPFIAMLVVRTALEDSLLRRNLPGYADYTKQTRWRLVPAVW